MATHDFYSAVCSFRLCALFHAIQTGLNIQIDSLGEMKLKIHTDLEKQAEIVRYLDVIEKMVVKEESMQ
jgi:hypothetical protein